MLFVKRIIVLSGERKGVLKLEKLGDNLSGTLSLSPIDNNTKIGIKMGDTPIFEQNIQSIKESFRLPIGSDIEGEIACVVTDRHAKAFVASGANYKGCCYPKLMMEMAKNVNLAKEMVAEVIVEKKIATVQEQIKTTPNNKKRSANDADDSITVSAIDVEVLQEETAQVIKSNINDSESNINIHEVLLNGEEDDDILFYDKIKERLEELLASYPHDDELEKTVHSSKWVRVDYDDGNYYVVGVIEEDGEPLFICYGVPVGSREDKLAESKSTCEWLPLNRDNVNGRGYWVLYQDARTGETVS